MCMYLVVAAVLFVIAFLRISYVFIMDQEPFDKRHKADVEHLGFILFVAFCLCFVWPLSLPILTVLKIRDVVQKRKAADKKGLNLG